MHLPAHDGVHVAAGEDHLALDDLDDGPEGDIRLAEVLHIEFLEIALRKVAHGHDADHAPLIVGDGHRAEIALLHDAPKVAEIVRRLDDRLAFQHDVLDAGVQIHDQLRRVNLEIVQRVLRLRIDLARARRNRVLPHLLLQFRVRDGGADGIRVWIAMPDDIHRFCIFHYEIPFAICIQAFSTSFLGQLARKQRTSFTRNAIGIKIVYAIRMV